MLKWVIYITMILILRNLFLSQKYKMLAYRFNGILNSVGELLIKIMHSVVIDNYIAAEEIQNQN